MLMADWLDAILASILSFSDWDRPSAARSVG
jgi:hypothetical protein